MTSFLGHHAFRMMLRGLCGEQNLAIFELLIEQPSEHYALFESVPPSSMVGTVVPGLWSSVEEVHDLVFQEYSGSLHTESEEW